MSAKYFVDTNILVYAHDTGSGVKHDRARDLLRRLWDERTGVVSTQVVQEFYVNVRRRAQRALPAAQARRLAEDYLSWHVVVNDGDSILEAIDMERRFGLSFRDALIVRAANAAGAETLYSEDLNPGQRYGAVRVVNPLLSS